ncbi:MAG: hypothetical protein RR271_04400 [Oscillospiraceae bacterium]
MTRRKELLRKLAATVLAVVLMTAMIIFAFKMLLSVPIFDPILQTILMICTGILSLATLYFLYAKVSEIFMLMHTPRHKNNVPQSTATQESTKQTANK